MFRLYHVKINGVLIAWEAWNPSLLYDVEARKLVMTDRSSALLGSIQLNWPHPFHLTDAWHFQSPSEP